jgi:hypothetical protein
VRKLTPRRWALSAGVLVVIVAALGGVSLWAVVNARGEGNSRPVSTTTAASPRSTPTPTPTAPPKLITKGITIQILNGSRKWGAGHGMERRLNSLGYTVAVVLRAAHVHSTTTVYWARPEDRAAAQALAAHFGWRSGPKPPDLSAEVDLHVVVGKDAVS